MLTACQLISCWTTNPKPRESRLWACLIHHLINCHEGHTGTACKQNEVKDFLHERRRELSFPPKPHGLFETHMLCFIQGGMGPIEVLEL